MKGVRKSAAGPTAWPRAAAIEKERGLPERIYNVLFLCTGNSARSIMAEAILNRLGDGRFKAFSAGSLPRGQVNPLALQLLEERDHPTADLRSKSWAEFSGPGAIPLDFIFTLCDSAARETCPLWPGQPMTGHWGLPDPDAVAGTESARLAAFADCYRALESRIDRFIKLPMRTLDELSLQRHLAQIGMAQSDAAAEGSGGPT